MNKKSLLIGIPVFILLLVVGISALLFKFRYDKTVQTRETENAIRDAARAGTVFPIDGAEMNTVFSQDAPVENSIVLSIVSPASGTHVTSPTITVRGKTVAKAEVFVNEKELIAGSDGYFQVSYTLDEGENILLIVASDADGNAAEEELTLTYNSGDE